MPAESEPKLAAPGAGLPWLELMVARYWTFPRFCRRTTWEQADEIFAREGQKILALVEPLDAATLRRRVLIDRFPGIEDSSRYWSPAMVLEHLDIVGSLMTHAVVELSHGRLPQGKADVAAVKPKGTDGGDPVGEFRDFLLTIRGRLAKEVGDRESPTRFLHPWFGPLGVHQWHCLLAAHQAIHRRQLKLILVAR
ncbi:MAG: DinB family protein [Verrucomicrobia bacterium]|nr:DinB family protein [Verrucomicrobiota bacterium]